MDQRFETGTVVGKKSDTHWAQIVKTPYAYGVVEIDDDEGKAQKVGMEIIHKVTSEVSESVTSISHLLTFIDSLWNPHIQTLILCIPIGNTITIILRGIGVVYLKRDGHIARLRSSEGTISGSVYTDDILFLSSKTCLNGISEDELFSFFDHTGVEDIAQKLTLHLHKKNDTVGYAGLFVEAKGGIKQTHPADAISIEQVDAEETGIKVSGHGAFNWKNRLIQHAPRLFWVKQKVKYVIRTLRNVDFRISGILLLLFFISIGIGIVRERSGKKSTEVTTSIQEVQRLYEEGVVLLDLNLVKSRERLVEAKQLVEKTKLTVSPKTKEGRMLGELEKKIAEALPQATKEFTVTPELFFDVSLLKSGSTIDTFGLYEDTMAFLDTNSKTVFALQLSTKNGQIVGGGGLLDGSQTVTIHGDKIYVFTPEGIHVFNIQDKTVKQLVIKKAADWISIKALSAFGGNLYLLDTGKSRIWKYVATASAFSDLREYLLPDYFPDLSKATNMVIDGSVWLGTTTGTITRFTQGREDVFIPKGVDPGFGTNVIVYTDDNCVNIYVLDPDNKRVVVLEKDGMYTSQYKYPVTFTPKTIAVSEKLGKLFFFSEGKLYTVSLK